MKFQEIQMIGVLDFIFSDNLVKKEMVAVLEEERILRL